MTCDEVFQYLTRVNPALPDGERIAEHLSQCPECRQMADLFRPAVALFSEQVPEGRPVNGCWRDLSEAADVAQQAAGRLSRGVPSARAAWAVSLARVARYAALVLLAAALGWGGHAMLTTRQALPGGPVAAQTQPTQCDALLTYFREASGRQLCPTCGQDVRLNRSQVVAMCVVCHVSGDIESRYPSDPSTSANAL